MSTPSTGGRNSASSATDAALLPIEFVNRMKDQLGPESRDFFQALAQRPSVSILKNPDKKTDIEGSPVAWNEGGIYLAERPSYVEDPLYHAGAYYPQEASSMVIAEIVNHLDIAEDAFCLDLCGAPGGKSLNLLQSLPRSAFLVSNEVIKSRVNILNENLRKWGRYNVAISSIHPSEWRNADSLFDLILVDAPCSGEGMFRKEGGKAIEEWSPDNVKFCAERQESILENIIPCLKPGGYLIYSTCTYSREENDDILRYIKSKGLHPVQFTWPLSHDFVALGNESNAYQAFPHKLKGEGLFFSVFQRPGSTERLEIKARTSGENIPMEMKLPEGYDIVRFEDQFFLKSSLHEDSLERIRGLRGPVKHELPLGIMKGKDFIPSHELAMTDLLTDPIFMSLDHDRSIRYLRRETFPIEGTEDGWYLASYENVALGWIKIASGRMKNHYPKGWMIRKRW